jgi:hypothetical protein
MNGIFRLYPIVPDKIASQFRHRARYILDRNVFLLKEGHDLILDVFRGKQALLPSQGENFGKRKCASYYKYASLFCIAQNEFAAIGSTFLLIKVNEEAI